MELRAAEAQDLPKVLSFWHMAAENTSRPPDSPAALASLHLRDPAALLLAVEEGKIVGTIIAGWDGWRCHLYRLAVAPDRRRAGIGKALIAAAEDRFRGLGGTRVDAMVLDENLGAHGVWRASGYAPQDDWSRWIKTL